MASIMDCPACGRPFTIEQQGGQVRCSECDALVDVPSMPPPGPPTHPAPLRSVVPLRQGLAIGALVCGILSLVTCLFPIGIVAIVLGIVALVKASGEPDRYGGRGLAIGGLCTGAASFFMILPLMISILLPSLSRARELSKRVVCGANLQSIRYALDSYASTNNGQFPPDWATLASVESLPPQVFLCPSSGAALGDLDACYVLIDPGDALFDSRTVAIYENSQCHGGEGGTVCFDDGHCEFFLADDLAELVEELQRGRS